MGEKPSRHSQLDWKRETERGRELKDSSHQLVEIYIDSYAVCFTLVQRLDSVRFPNLVGSIEDTVGGVEGTQPIGLGAGVYGDADFPITLIALLTGAADL